MFFRLFYDSIKVQNLHWNSTNFENKFQKPKMITLGKAKSWRFWELGPDFGESEFETKEKEMSWVAREIALVRDEPF